LSRFCAARCEQQKKDEGYLVSYGAMADNFERPEMVTDRLGLKHLADSDLGRYWADYWAHHPGGD
jgi:hypothetical protein